MSEVQTSEDQLARFLSLHPRKIDLSLGRIEALLEKLGSPHRRLPPVIHVAGTNGKGSTVAFMRAFLEAAGKRVHVYTSPHLVRFHERIRLAGKLVSEADLVQAFADCEKANAGAAITLFEITTAAAFKLFADHSADYLLLEVGLGGRFDATNVIDRPAASVITPVSYDHPEFLGTELAGIAGEKAGIIKRDTPVISGWQASVALDVIERQAQRLRAPLIVGGQDFNCYEQHGRFVYEDQRGLLDLPRPRLPGQHQFENAATAIAALRTVVPDLPAAAYEEGMGKVDWPARLQRLGRGALFSMIPEGAELWLDGGHNEAGGKVLAEAMADFEETSPRPLVLICGTLNTKDTAGFLARFSGLAQELYAVAVPGEHAARSAAEVASIARGADITAAEASGVQDALRAISTRRWAVPPRILITGSLYLAGEVLKENGTPPD